jgi:hypothetical protein
MANGTGRSGWAAFFGAILGSSVITAIIPLLPIYLPPSRVFEWSKVPGPPKDCGAVDTAATYSTRPPPKPAPENCSASDEGTIAICWDGIEYKNPLNPKRDPALPWCTYKATSPDKCQGGQYSGIVWQCKQVPKG